MGYLKDFYINKNKNRIESSSKQDAFDFYRVSVMALDVLFKAHDSKIKSVVPIKKESSLIDSLLDSVFLPETEYLETPPYNLDVLLKDNKDSFKFTCEDSPFDVIQKIICNGYYKHMVEFIKELNFNPDVLENKKIEYLKQISAKEYFSINSKENKKLFKLFDYLVHKYDSILHEQYPDSLHKKEDF